MAAGARAGAHQEVADLGGQRVELGRRSGRAGRVGTRSGPGAPVHCNDRGPGEENRNGGARRLRASARRTGTGRARSGRPRPRSNRPGRRTSASSPVGTGRRSPRSPAASARRAGSAGRWHAARMRSTSLPPGANSSSAASSTTTTTPPGRRARPDRGQRLHRVRHVVQRLEVERDVVRRLGERGVGVGHLEAGPVGDTVRLGVGPRVHHRRVVAVDPEHLEGGVGRGERDARPADAAAEVERLGRRDATGARPRRAGRAPTPGSAGRGSRRG